VQLSADGGSRYSPDNRLAVKVSARNIAPTRDPAVLLIGQLKEIYIDGELEMVDTTNWFPKVLRKDFTVGMVVSEAPISPSAGAGGHRPARIRPVLQRLWSVSPGRRRRARALGCSSSC
jgi:hypothetical protein